MEWVECTVWSTISCALYASFFLKFIQKFSWYKETCVLQVTSLLSRLAPFEPETIGDQAFQRLWISLGLGTVTTSASRLVLAVGETRSSNIHSSVLVVLICVVFMCLIMRQRTFLCNDRMPCSCKAAALWSLCEPIAIFLWFWTTRTVFPDDTAS